jgi:tetratricopeptide (TPR) repeat protein
MPLTVLLVLALSGCAARGVRIDARAVAAAQAADVARADALITAGCYRCLLEAADLYERARVRSQPPLELREQRFAVALLLALREKELGLPATRWSDAAASLAATGASPGDALYLDVVKATPWERAGGSQDFDNPPRVTPDDRARWKMALSAMAVSATAPRRVLDQYLLVTVFCSISPGPPAQERLPLDLIDLNQPILEYRVGICNSDQRDRLAQALAAEPRLAEANFFLGRYELGAVFTRRDWLTAALPLLSAAHDALPEVPIVSVTYAGALRARGALARAIAVYDEALAVRPAQREALLGRVVALTYLNRPAEAIVSASRMIELGTWYIGDAYYWRALNHYQSGDSMRAAEDVAIARQTLINSDVMTLSGRIAYDQQRRTDARADFTEARRLEPNNCVAAWYLGLIDIDDESWRTADAMLSSAAGCYTAAAEAFRADLQQLPADLPEDARQQQAADFDRRIIDSLRQAARSSFNAAQASLRIGDTAAAIDFARTAAAQQDMRERAEALIRSLEQHP